MHMACIYLYKMNELSTCMYTQRGTDRLSINMNIPRGGNRLFVYKYVHIREVDGLFMYIKESTKEERMVRLSAYKHVHVKSPSSVLSMLFHSL